MASFSMQELHVREGTRLTVSGALDLANADQFAERLQRLSRTGAKVMVDLSGVGFMDSSGLNALVNAISEARRANHSIEVGPELTRQVRRLLEITGVENFVLAP